jgi:ribosomal protein S18 acetylase RimI-like enzyme
MLIRSLERQDYEAWLPLWNANCLNQISDDVTKETWRRITNPKETIFGLGSFDDEGMLCGILHYILHPTTGFKEPACYMQDLYTAEDCRRQGIAKQLILELNAIGKTEKWARIYWFAENNNESVQSLYKNLGIPMDFTLFILQKRS